MLNVSDILYTTGTTGKAKGVMLSAKAWTANAENLIDRLGFTPELLFIICGPMNHLGSLSKIYPTLMTGATLYIMESLKDLNAFFSVFELPFTKFATFLVPSSIRMLLQVASKNLADVASKIDFIFITPQIKVSRTMIPQNSPGYPLSDHNPHWADLEF